MGLRPIGAGKAAVTTAVLLFIDEPSGSLATALDCIRSASNWELQRYEMTVARAEAFQCIKAPVLIVYNASGDEAMRTIGDRNIENFIACFKDDML